MTNHRRGREVFYRLHWLITLITALYAVIPNCLRRISWNIINSWCGMTAIGLRYCMLKASCKKCGDNVMVGPYVEIISWRNLEIGKNVSIHRGCYLDCTGGMHIGDDVSIAHASSFISFEHTWDDLSLPIKDNPIRRERIMIDDDVWIGCGSRILAGVSIGRRSVVAAGAVVTKDVPEGSVVGGVPAKQIMDIPLPNNKVAKES